MTETELLNPFPGPQPYRHADRERFFGRGELTQRLLNHVLARPLTTIFGPSGAGKSSIMQAGVIPLLETKHRYRTTRVDSWPADDQPLEWLVNAMVEQLELGDPTSPSERIEALEEALELAQLRSERPILLYLDQLEQLLLPGRDAAEIDALLAGLERLDASPVNGLLIVLSLREDYLGRFRDRTRRHAALLDKGFRVAPLSVGEMTVAMCCAAASGSPSQTWARDDTAALLVEVRVPGTSATLDAEVEAAFAQIVCRALWEQRAVGETGRAADTAETIVRRYVELILAGFGANRDAARELLEQHLVDRDGHRTLLTEDEALILLPVVEARTVLDSLASASILRAAHHQGRRYFELGHDWLAKWVYERRRERDARRREHERKEAEDRRIEEEARARGRLRFIALGAVAVALAMTAVVIWALTERSSAQAAKTVAQRAESVANEAAEASSQAARASERDAGRARDALLMNRARQLASTGRAGTALGLMLEISHPEEVAGWATFATALAAKPIAIPFPDAFRRARLAEISWDEKTIAYQVERKDIELWDVSLRRTVSILHHVDDVEGLRISNDSRLLASITRQRDPSPGNVVVWTLGTDQQPTVLPVRASTIAIDPAEDRIAVLRDPDLVQIWGATGELVDSYKAGETTIESIRFSPDGTKLLLACSDQSVRIWRPTKDHSPLILRHPDAVVSAVFHPLGEHILTTSSAGAVRVWEVSGKEPPVVLMAGGSSSSRATTAVFSDDIVFAGLADGTVRSWSSVLEPTFDEDPTHLAVRMTRKVAANEGWSSKQFASNAYVQCNGFCDRVTVSSLDGSAVRIFSPWDLERALPVAEGMLAHHPVTGNPGSKMLLWQYPSWTLWDIREAIDRQLRLPKVGTPGDVRLIGYAAGRPVTLSGAGDLVRWDIVEGQMRPARVATVIEQHPRSRTAALSDNGQTLLLGPTTAIRDNGSAGSKALRRPLVFDLASMASPRPLEGDSSWPERYHYGMGRSAPEARFSPDGSRIARVGADGALRVWDTTLGGEPLATVTTGLSSSPSPMAAAISPDGTNVVVTRGSVAYLYDVDSPPVLLKVFSGHTGTIRSSQFSADGQLIVTAAEDGTVRVWGRDFDPEPQTFLQSYQSSSAISAPSASLSPDGAHLAAASFGDVEVWEMGSGERRRLGGVPGRAFMRGLKWSPNSQRLLAVSSDGDVYVWSLDDLESPLVARFERPVGAANFGWDGDWVLTATRESPGFRAWPLSALGVRQAVRTSFRECLSVEDRQRYLGVDRADAELVNLMCERVNGRASTDKPIVRIQRQMPQIRGAAPN